MKGSFSIHTKELMEFIDKSPSPFHVVQNLKEWFLEEGFTELAEGDAWQLSYGSSYFVTRNGSAMLAFRVPEQDAYNFQMVAAHSDAPCFKVKQNPEMVQDGAYVVLNTEKYGGMLMAPWFDRPLSVAGRVMVRSEEGFSEKLVHVDRDILMIPNLAIHMNREANDGYKYNAQKDMLPLLGMADQKGTFLKIVADAAGVSEEAILSLDLFLYNRQKGVIWGGAEEFFSIGKIDDLQCVYAGAKALLQSGHSASIQMLCVFDNEEVGSTTIQGADSDFLPVTVQRIGDALSVSSEALRRMVARSYMVSADNGHGVHPNYTEKADPTNRPYLNGGVVIKSNGNRKYTTDAVTEAVVKSLCERKSIPYQSYLNRSDIAGGSTLGNIADTHLSIRTVDIGAAQLAMHSPYETGGVKDTKYLMEFMAEFYGTTVRSENNNFILK